MGSLPSSVRAPAAEGLPISKRGLTLRGESLCHLKRTDGAHAADGIECGGGHVVLVVSEPVPGPAQQVQDGSRSAHLLHHLFACSLLHHRSLDSRFILRVLYVVVLLYVVESSLVRVWNDQSSSGVYWKNQKHTQRHESSNTRNFENIRERERETLTRAGATSE